MFHFFNKKGTIANLLFFLSVKQDFFLAIGVSYVLGQVFKDVSTRRPFSNWSPMLIPITPNISSLMIPHSCWTPRRRTTDGDSRLGGFNLRKKRDPKVNPLDPKIQNF